MHIKLLILVIHDWRDYNIVLIWQLFLTMMIMDSALLTKKSSLPAHKHLLHRRANPIPLNRRLHLLVQCVSVPLRSFVQCPFQTLSVTWQGKMMPRSPTKNIWFWQALHAGWTACGWNLVAWEFWCTSLWVKAKCRRHFQKSQRSFCLLDTLHGVPGGGQKALVHNHECTSNYVVYVFYIHYIHYDFYVLTAGLSAGRY